MAKAPDIVAALKEGGTRITKVRRALLEIFCKSKVPLAATELLEQLNRRSLNVNKSTVYRELDFFEERKIIREIDLMDGKKRYEVLAEHDHHHHMICTSCRSIRCVEMANDLDELEADIFSKFKFKVTSHTLEFFGVCSRCQESAPS